MAEENEHWTLISQQMLVQDPWLTVYENSYRLPDGSQLEGYHALEERSGVMIVALTEQREVLLVRQYRPGADRLIYELPAGFMEQDETDALQRAQTELREETGYQATEWQPLGELHDLPSRMSKITYCFLALDARKATEQDEDSTEFVRYEALPLHEVQQMIQAGAITSAVTIAALFKAGLWLERTSKTAEADE
jgi:8-oxo-dGTP pyrophosphatase MutT (NUDIX family)